MSPCPSQRIADFIRRGHRCGRAVPSRRARFSAFGHVGDGNLHYDVLCPAVGEDIPAFIARWAEGSQVVHDVVARYDGSISAEHGLGRLKTDEAAATNHRSRSRPCRESAPRSIRSGS
jgi:FAD/FMN-containing dehydrogenase